MPAGPIHAAAHPRPAHRAASPLQGSGATVADDDVATTPFPASVAAGPSRSLGLLLMAALTAALTGWSAATGGARPRRRPRRRSPRGRPPPSAAAPGPADRRRHRRLGDRGQRLRLHRLRAPVRRPGPGERRWSRARGQPRGGRPDQRRAAGRARRRWRDAAAGGQGRRGAGDHRRQRPRAAAGHLVVLRLPGLVLLPAVQAVARNITGIVDAGQGPARRTPHPHPGDRLLERLRGRRRRQRRPRSRRTSPGATTCPGG